MNQSSKQRYKNPPEAARVPVKRSGVGRYLWLAIPAVIIVLMIIASFADLKISFFFTGSTAEDVADFVPGAFALWIRGLGAFPGALLTAFSLVIIALRTAGLKKAKGRYIIAGVIFLFAFLTSLYACAYFTASVSGKLTFGRFMLAFLAAAVLTAALFLTSVYMGPKKIRGLFSPALYTLISAVTILAVTGILRLVWSRPDFLALAAAGDAGAFVPWYKPALFSGASGFPSIQTAFSALLLVFPAWIKAKDGAVFTGVSIIAWTALVTVGCISCGCAYLSDAVVGFTVGLLTQYLIRSGS